MSQLSSHHVLFYSKKCKHCKELFELMSSLSIWDKFVNICVEETRPLPKSVKSVPTIIVPTHKNPLEGEEVFMWIRSYGSQLLSANQSIKQNTQKVNQQDTQQSNEQDGEVQAFFGSELNSCLSDKFSFIGEMEGKPLQHQYEYLDNSYASMSNNTVMPTSSNNDNSKNNKGTDMDNAYNSLLESRNNDIAINRPIDRT